MLICWTATGPQISDYLQPYIQQVMAQTQTLSVDLQIEYFCISEEADVDAILIQRAFHRLLEKQGTAMSTSSQLNMLSMNKLTPEGLLGRFTQEEYGQLAVVTPTAEIQAKLRNSAVAVFPARSTLSFAPLDNLGAGKWCLLAYDSIALVRPRKTTKVTSAFLKFYRKHRDSIQMVALYDDKSEASDKAKFGALKAQGITLNHACSRPPGSSDAKRIWLSVAVAELLDHHPELAGCIVIGPEDHNIKSIGFPVIYAKPVHWVNAHEPNQFLPEAATVLKALMQNFNSPDRQSRESSLFVMN